MTDRTEQSAPGPDVPNEPAGAPRRPEVPPVPPPNPPASNAQPTTQPTAQPNPPAAASGPATSSPLPSGWPPPTGTPVGTGNDPTRLPPGRPDFEPPPPWARPDPAEASRSQPVWTPLGGSEADETAGHRPRLLKTMVILVAVVLVTSAASAVAGVYFGPRFFGYPSASPTPTPDDDFGDQQVAFDKPQDVSTVAKSVLPSTVHVQVRASNGQAQGSGFVLSEDGYILTNNHVIAPAADGGRITLVFHDASEATASVVGRSPSYDLAVLEVDDPAKLDLRPVALGKSDSVLVGEPIVAIGAPLGLAGTVTSGIISAKDRPVTAGGEGEVSFISALQLDAAINPGNSGGPLVNLRAEVVGVNSAIATLSSDSIFGEEVQQGNIGLGFAIPIDQARRTADQLIENGYAVYPVIGVTIDGNYGGEGVRVEGLTPSSAAGEAGIEPGDLVTAIDGTRVNGPDDLIVAIRSRVPGETVELTYTRAGTRQTATVVLDEETG